MSNVPKDLEQLLDASGLSWRIEQGSRHQKIIVEERFVAIMPNAMRRNGSNYRSHKNMLAQVRRAIRENV